MNREYKEKWLEKLSVKNKTKGHLKDSVGMCCLGVLASIIMETNPELGYEWNEDTLREGVKILVCRGEKISATTTSFEIDNLTGITGVVNMEDANGSIMEVSVKDRLIGLNDTSKTFEESVIPFIEEYL